MAALCVAHRTLGTTCMVSGELTSGLRHLEQAWALYDRERHSQLRHRYGQDIGVAALCYRSWALWHLGHVDQASQVANEAVQHAEKLLHPHTLVYALCHARAFIDLFNGRADDIDACAEMIVSLCAEHRFSHWMNCGRILQGWAAICRGDVDRGLEVLCAGVAAWRDGGARLWMPTFLALEAEAYARAGRSDAALLSIDHAIAVSGETGECWAKPELLRSKAGLLLAAGRAPVREIEDLLVSGLALARRQHEPGFELRAACVSGPAQAVQGARQGSPDDAALGMRPSWGGHGHDGTGGSAKPDGGSGAGPRAAGRRARQGAPRPAIAVLMPGAPCPAPRS